MMVGTMFMMSPPRYSLVKIMVIYTNKNIIFIRMWKNCQICEKILTLLFALFGIKDYNLYCINIGGINTWV